MPKMMKGFLPGKGAPLLEPGKNGVPPFSGGVRIVAGADAPEAIEKTKILWKELGYEK